MAIQLPNAALLNSLNSTARRSLLVALFTLLLLRGRISDVPTAAFSKLKTVVIRQDISQEDLTQALQQVYISEPDGSKTLLVPYKGHISKVRFSSVYFRAYMQVLCALGHHLPHLVICSCKERETLPPRPRIQQNQPRQDLSSTTTPHPQDSLSVVAFQGSLDSRYALVLPSPAYCFEHRGRTSRRAHRP